MVGRWGMSDRAGVRRASDVSSRIVTQSYAQLIDWLVQEVNDLMGAGAVGVYELVEILRSLDDPPTDEVTRAVALTALNLLLATQVADLEWRRWAEDWSAPASTDDVSDASWETPTAAPYLVVVPT